MRLAGAILGFLYVEAILLPLLLRAPIAREKEGMKPAASDRAIDLALDLPTFGVAFPRTDSQISLLKERQRLKEEQRSHSSYAQAFAAPFGPMETPTEVKARRRREAFEDRSPLSSTRP
jgi:hypothetical protein